MLFIICFHRTDRKADLVSGFIIFIRYGNDHFAFRLHDHKYPFQHRIGRTELSGPDPFADHFLKLRVRDLFHMLSDFCFNTHDLSSFLFYASLYQKKELVRSQWRELKNYLRFTPFFFFSRFIDIVFITSMK